MSTMNNFTLLLQEESLSITIIDKVYDQDFFSSFSEYIPIEKESLRKKSEKNPYIHIEVNSYDKSNDNDLSLFNKIEVFPDNFYFRKKLIDKVELIDDLKTHKILSFHKKSRYEFKLLVDRNFSSERVSSLLLRLIRDVIQNFLHKKGYVALHMSSVSDSKGRVIGFMGNKGAGKTGIMLKLLKQDNHFFANDRVFFSPKTKAIIPFPIAAMVSKESLVDIPESLQIKLDNNETRRKDHFLKGYEKIGFTPREISDAYKCKMFFNGTLDKLYILKTSPSLCIENISNEEILGVFSQNVYSPVDPTYLWNWSVAEVDESRDICLKKLIKSLNIEKLSFNFCSLSSEFLMSLL